MMVTVVKMMMVILMVVVFNYEPDNADDLIVRDMMKRF